MEIGEDVHPKKQKYSPPLRTWMLVRRQGEVFVPIRPMVSTSARACAMKIAHKVGDGQRVFIQDTTTGRTHEYSTVIEKIPLEKRTPAQKTRGITRVARVYKKATLNCPACSSVYRKEYNGGRPTASATTTTETQTDDEVSDSSSSDSDSDSGSDDGSDSDDDATTDFEDFSRNRRRDQRQRREDDEEDYQSNAGKRKRRAVDDD